MIFGRRRQPAPAEVPVWPSHPATVAGFAVQVHESPWSVCAYLEGVIQQQVIAVRPRERPEPDPRVHPWAQQWLTVFAKRPHEVPTGDAGFDARYVVEGPAGLLPAFTLTDPLRALLVAHDVVVLVAHARGAWVGVAHEGPAGRDAAEAAALRALALLVRT